MTALADANVLIALAITDHVHHHAAEQWFANRDGPFATCPITQRALVRLIVRRGGRVDDALAALGSITSHDDHEFWPDTLDYEAVDLGGVVGHRQVTDAYLAGLARHRGGRLVTFEGGLAAQHPDVVDLIEIDDRA